MAVPEPAVIQICSDTTATANIIILSFCSSINTSHYVTIQKDN